MLRKELEGIQWLEFELLAEHPNIKHGIFLRHGGVSEGIYSSLNLGLNTEDSAASVKLNLDKIQNLFSIPQIHRCYQVHGKDIVKVTTENNIGIVKGDCLITDDLNKGLMINHADCQAALFYDPVKNVIANAHAGWRGSVQNIYAETIKCMSQEYHSLPENILVCISPSLGPHDSQFLNFQKELPESFWEFQIKPFYFDFWEISRRQLIDAGIHPEHIQIAKISSFSNTQDFFSFRHDNRCGRNGTYIMLF